MGKHFDTLVELVKKHIGPEETPWPGADGIVDNVDKVQPYLERLIQRATLFELPFGTDKIRPEMDDAEFGRYVRDYISLSQKYRKFLLMPFELTAIENPYSVIIFDPLEQNKYLVTICQDGTALRAPSETMTVSCGAVEVLPPDDNFRFHFSKNAFYNAIISHGKRVDRPITQAMERAVMQDLGNEVHAYITNLVYIMDPDNFIIRKEHKQSRKHTARGRNPNMLRKTIMRPHYVCLSEQDTRTFLTGESKEPWPAHPVRGHWRTLMSERFTRKRGQRIYVAQYFTGQGQIEGMQGWTYEVMVKDAPDKIVPYSQVSPQDSSKTK